MQNPGSEGKYSSEMKRILIWLPLEVWLGGTSCDPHHRPRIVFSARSSISTKSYLADRNRYKSVDFYTCHNRTSCIAAFYLPAVAISSCTYSTSGKKLYLTSWNNFCFDRCDLYLTAWINWTKCVKLLGTDLKGWMTVPYKQLLFSSNWQSSYTHHQWVIGFN